MHAVHIYVYIYKNTNGDRYIMLDPVVAYVLL